MALVSSKCVLVTFSYLVNYNDLIIDDLFTATTEIILKYIKNSMQELNYEQWRNYKEKIVLNCNYEHHPNKHTLFFCKIFFPN